ncbi:uncharacterized protein LOC117648499 isoform X2 [Thrips palmi]|nr:uncharacterized protein LOC117648499 isoform X2 [Thrips palmi]XP_034247094.1 uncharacterized protein LOC117648499 isoform X2 [Thrips palmi]
MSVLIASACAADESATNSNRPLPFKLFNKKEMTHEALIRQACTLTANSSSQLLTQVLIAINETSQEYRKSMSDLMVLLEESLLLLTNSRTSPLDEVEELIVKQRTIVDEQHRLLLELVSLMDYVEKMMTSTAETAFLAGAEQSSTLMCERLNSALYKVGEECAANKNSEEELLKLQEAYVIKLGELYEREWKDNPNLSENVNKEELVPNEEISNASLVTPIDIFEDSHETGDKANDPELVL